MDTSQTASFQCSQSYVCAMVMLYMIYLLCCSNALLQLWQSKSRRKAKRASNIEILFQGLENSLDAKLLSASPSAVNGFNQEKHTFSFHLPGFGSDTYTEEVSKMGYMQHEFLPWTEKWVLFQQGSFRNALNMGVRSSLCSTPTH